MGDPKYQDFYKFYKQLSQNSSKTRHIQYLLEFKLDLTVVGTKIRNTV
jgi:hypothetical protein